MELLLTSSESSRGSVQNHENTTFEPGGLLNSNYQTVVKLSHNTSSSNSLYKLKQRVKINGFNQSSSAEVLLKLAIFTAVILSLFNS